MKNWRTTLLGLIGGLPFAIEAIVDAYNSGYFTDKAGWQLAGSVIFAILMAIIKDPKKTLNIDIPESNEKPVVILKDAANFADGDGDGKVTPDKPPLVEGEKDQ